MPRRNPLFELYRTRLREFYRQPARIFWVYGFPTVMAIGLGLAFRSKGAESVQLDFVQRHGSAMSEEIEKYLRDYDAGAARQNKPRLVLKVVPEDEARQRL